MKKLSTLLMSAVMALGISASAFAAPVGVVNITQREICIGRGLCSLKPNAAINLDYAYHALTTYQSDFETKSTGTIWENYPPDQCATPSVTAKRDFCGWAVSSLSGAGAPVLRGTAKPEHPAF